MRKQLGKERSYDFLHCRNSKALTSDQTFAQLDRIVARSGFGFKNSIHWRYSGGGDGFTYAAIIGESIVDLHTWPEYDNRVHVRIYYCDYKRNNEARADRLLKLLKQYLRPKKIRRHRDAIRYI